MIYKNEEVTIILKKPEDRYRVLILYGLKIFYKKEVRV
jgi:hypothetical protein